MLSATYFFSLFALLTASSVVYFIARRVRIPYTVLLVAFGTFVLLPLSWWQPFDFIDEFKLTPDILFYIFLPILIFESAYNISIRRLVENARSISLLAVVSLLVSTAFIGIALTLAFRLIGIHIPYELAFLFGALISATDPVAVLALFKEYGAPRRLSLIFEGESIFNDATAVALFFVILGIVIEGTGLTLHSFGDGLLTFIVMMVGGALAGLLAGGVFSTFVGWTRENEFVSITLTIALAHLTFIGTDLLSQTLVIGDFHVHISAIIATTVASMVMGNYGRSKISPQAEEFVEKFWGQFAFLANSVVFLLIGLIFSGLPFSVSSFALPVLISVIVVAVGRALSIYPVVALLNITKVEAPIPRSWQHLLAWGSLRGALAITMVLLIPDDLAIAGWQYAFSPKEFLLALTIGCIFATLFLKAPTIGPLIRRLKIDEFTDLERAEIAEARALMQTRALARLRDYGSKGYVEAAIAERLDTERTEAFKKAREAVKVAVERYKDKALADRALRLYAIGIERHYLKELYAYGEVTEKVYKQISIKLTQQQERLAQGNFDIEETFKLDGKELFEHMAHWVRSVFARRDIARTPEENYMYYRAQSIIARKVLKEFDMLEEATGETLFDASACAEARKVYGTFHTNAGDKMRKIGDGYAALIRPLSERLARRGLLKTERRVLEDLKEKEMITPKIYIALSDEIEEAASKVPEEVV